MINIYARTRKAGEKKQMILQESNTASDIISEVDAISENDLCDVEEGYSESDDGVYPTKQHGSRISKGKEMSVEYLENEVDVFRSVDDWDGIDVLNLACLFSISFGFVIKKPS